VLTAGSGHDDSRFDTDHNSTARLAGIAWPLGSAFGNRPTGVQEYVGRVSHTTKLWFAVHENSLIVDRETGRHRLKGVFRIATIDTGDNRAVAAFTDGDLMERFLEALGNPEMVPLVTRTPEKLLELLENLRESGCDLVAFDHVPSFDPASNRP
jgi:hypothetical protein